MRVYGALLWSMGKIFRGAEVTRIYVGSFKDAESLKPELEPLFEKDRNVLMGHLKDLPRQCGMRKVNEMVKRITLNQTHVCILGNIRSKMPLIWGKESAQRRIIANLSDIFDEVSRAYNIDKNSFPDVKEFQAKLKEFTITHDFYSIPKLDKNVLIGIKALLRVDIPKITQCTY